MHARQRRGSDLLLLLLLLLATPAWSSWTMLEPGLDFGEFELPHAGPGYLAVTLSVLRADPATWSLELVYGTQSEHPKLRTTRGWCKHRKLVAAINGITTAVRWPPIEGFTVARGRVLTRTIKDYQSVAAFDPIAGRDLAPFRLFDLDAPGVTLDAIRRDYDSVMQNPRLIKRPGENRRHRQDKRLSRTALAEDARGRVLLVFCRTPLTAHDFNEALLEAGIGVVAAQYLESGRSAQMFVLAGEMERELVPQDEAATWRRVVPAVSIPVALGVRRRQPAQGETGPGRRH